MVIEQGSTPRVKILFRVPLLSMSDADFFDMMRRSIEQGGAFIAFDIPPNRDMDCSRDGHRLAAVQYQLAGQETTGKLYTALGDSARLFLHVQRRTRLIQNNRFLRIEPCPGKDCPLPCYCLRDALYLVECFGIVEHRAGKKVFC